MAAKILLLVAGVAAAATIAYALPTHFDWSQRGINIQAGNMGECGSGATAFPLAHAAAARQAIKHNKTMVPLSEQQIISCFGQGAGCDGEDPQKAYMRALNTTCGLVATAESYPFVSAQGIAEQCKHTGWTVGAQLKSITRLPPRSEKDMMQRIYEHGPVIACLDVTDTFMEYTGGVLNPPGSGCGAKQYNHCFTVTGWGSAQGVPYWNLCNDWGQEFGINGYVWLVRGKNCLGILDYAFEVEVV